MKRMMVGIWLLACAAAAPGGENLLKNPSFEDWKDAAPAGWTIAKGAGAPEGTESAVRQGADGGLALSGGGETRVWRIVSQEVPARRDGFYRLTFEARATGLRLDANQFDNAWVGLRAAGKDEKSPRMSIETIVSAEWTASEVVLSRPAADTLTVAAFLSKTGTLEVRRLVLEELRPGDSFDLLSRRVGRTYSYLDLKKLDWPAISARHRERFAAAKDEDAFVAAAKEMLGELKDLHVTIRRSDGRVEGTYVAGVKRNYDFKAVAAELKGFEQIGKVAFAGTTADGYGYVTIGTLQFDDATLARIVAAIESRLNAHGFLLDLRANGGGDERRALEIASIFADKERVYALSRFRNGPDPADLSAPFERKVGPRKARTFTKPVVCLIGPGCVSSGEGFVKMLKAQPHVTLVGQPTRGASGNPQPVELPNGVTVFLSTWVDLLPDGTVTEGTGIAPEVVVEHEGDGDPTFQAGVRVLRKKIDDEE